MAKITHKGVEYNIDVYEKVCFTCNKKLPITSFRLYGVSSISGLPLFRNQCKSCKNKKYKSNPKILKQRFVVDGKELSYWQLRYKNKQQDIKDRYKSYTDKLNDCYIRYRIRRSIKCNLSQITPELMEIKKTRILAMRFIKQLKKVK